MSIKDFLNEGISSIDGNVNDFIKQHCKQYLKLIKGKTPLYRGMNRFNMSIGIKDVRQNRMPRGMSIVSFKEFNKWLKKNKHITRDKSVIATSNKGNVKQFGYSYYIFPMGKFNYTWVLSKDINLNDKKTGWHANAVEDYQEKPKTFDTDHETKLSRPFEQYFQTNHGFDIAYKKGYEIWFDCKKYVFVDNDDYWWDILQGVII